MHNVDFFYIVFVKEDRIIALVHTLRTSAFNLGYRGVVQGYKPHD